MILYYTGTGNSRYAARRISEALGDELISMNELIKAGDTSPLEAGERVVIVTPTYAWRIPRIVRDWVEKTELRGAERVWFVMTCGGEIGNAAKYNLALAERLGLEYMGTKQVVMPENYIAMFSAPEVAEARLIVEKAQPDIEKAIAAIADGRAFEKPRSNLYDKLMSGPVNPVFYSFFVKSKAFAASAACIGCGKCASLCPTGSISLRDRRPVWGEGCTHCMACICYCPVSAIEYGKKSVGKPRYHIENL